jgi:ferritin
MMKETLALAINDQIQAEFQSAYLYLAMSAWCTEANLPGCAHWLRMQWQEETMHATKLFDFVHSRGGSISLKGLTEPRRDYASLVDVFAHVREHELYITSRINALYELAVTEKDYPLQIVLQWFINEQVEEEAQVVDLIERLKLIGSDGASIFLFDRQLASRPTPTTPTAQA